MNFSGNPMIQKELRQRMRERRGWILPSLYLVALSAVICLVYHLIAEPRGFSDVNWNGSNGTQGYDVGVALFLAAAYTQLGLLLLLAPIFSAGTLTIEKEQRTLAGLLTSLLGPAKIWWGKFAASLLFVLLLLVAGLPILTVAFAFGGIGIWEVFITSLTTVIILATMSAIGLYWSSAFRRSVHATAVSYVTVIVLTVVPWIIYVVAATGTRDDSVYSVPYWGRVALYANPAFFLTTAFVPRAHLYPAWCWCLVIFISVSIICSLLAVRNIRRSGDVS
jgi:ABC-type transport system involved in multi-copper enzyme maturation permease subunit